MIVQQIITITDSGKMRGLVNVIFFPAFTCHGCKNSQFMFFKGGIIEKSIYFRRSGKYREEEKRKEILCKTIDIFRGTLDLILDTHSHRFWSLHSQVWGIDSKRRLLHPLFITLSPHVHDNCLLSARLSTII